MSANGPNTKVLADASVESKADSNNDLDLNRLNDRRIMLNLFLANGAKTDIPDKKGKTAQALIDQFNELCEKGNIAKFVKPKSTTTTLTSTSTAPVLKS